jgi:hypothetical protein
MPQRLRLLAGLIGFATLAGLPSPVDAGTQISVEIFVGHQCAFGSGPAGTMHIVTLRTPRGEIRSRVRDRSDDRGSWGACFGAYRLNAEDTVTIRVGAIRRRVTVPRLTPSIDRVDDVIAGHAWPGSTVDIRVFHWRNLRDSVAFDFQAVAGPHGRYTLDAHETVDLLGGDELQVTVRRGDDLYAALAYVPVVTVGYANETVQGFANLETDVRVTLKDATGATKASRGAGALPFFGFQTLFTVSLYDDRGRPAYPLAGDRLIANVAPDARLRIPTTYLRVDLSARSFEARCMPRSPYSVAIGGSFPTYFGRTDSEGRLAGKLAPSGVRVGDYVQLQCRFPTGDIFYRETDVHG